MKGYPSWFSNTVIVAVTVLIVSGLLLAPTALDLRLEWSMPWRLPAEQRLSVVFLHTALAFLVFCLTGALWSIHMRAGWRRGQQVRSGVLLGSLLLLLALTGVGLFYLGDEMLLLSSSAAHLLAGVILTLIFVFHVVTGRRQRRHGHHH